MQKNPVCHAGSQEPAYAHHHHAAPGVGRWRLAAQSTRHCLIGCVIGEVIGLAIGVEAGLSTTATIILATTLAYISGFTLGLLPVMKGRGLSLVEAFKLIWIGEATSIGVMEIVMNAVDYQMGGMSAMSALSWPFFRGLLFAIPAGFVAAWPVNYWLLGKELKACH